MQINAIGSRYDTKCQYKKQPSFKKLIVDNSAKPIIKNMSKLDFFEFKQIRKRLAKTKYWDMRISGRGNDSNQLKFEFIDKSQKHIVITDGIYPYQKNENTIKIYSIIYGEDNLSNNLLKNLKFKSKQRADEVYNKYMHNMEVLRYKMYNITPIENIKNKETELNMLEEASGVCDISKTSDIVNT